MKYRLIVLFWLSALTVQAQNTLQWSENYELQLSDFQASTTKIGSDGRYQLYTTANFDLNYSMSNNEFMLTKNFNNKVNCTFNRQTASLVAPDDTTAQNMVALARCEFDLAELYARKLRKKIFEEKKAFSSHTLLHTCYEVVHAEFMEKSLRLVDETNFGNDRAKLAQYHSEVLKQIEILADFCKFCKPSKKKK